MTIPAWLAHTPRPVRWTAALAWMGIIFFLSAQPDLPHPSSSWLDMVLSCGAHFVLFGVLALLLAWALGHGRRGMFVALGLACLYALSDEFHQSFVPDRVADPLDLACDAAGAGIALAAWAWLRRQR